jgi:hypothetical protein
MSNYLPIPPRVWSRVQNPCTYIYPNDTYESVYIPLTNQTVSLAQANYEDKLQYKGNILQYKGNSARLNKSQKYSQLAKCLGPSRTKVFATQSQTYTNPNTTGLLRVNYATFPYPNQIVGAPNNISGPFQYDVRNPNGCAGTSIQDGGNLVCGTYANPCTGEILKTGVQSSTVCNPSYCSDVPGKPIALCWNYKAQTWFPKQRYVMNNSTSKWPQGYKAFVSAVKPDAPVLTLVSSTDTTANLTWTYNSTDCLPISEFIIYNNNKPIKIVTYTIQNITANLVTGNNYFNVTSVTNGIESSFSNTIVVNPSKVTNNSGGGSNNSGGGSNNSGGGSNNSGGGSNNSGGGSNNSGGGSSNVSVGTVSNTDFGKFHVIENTNNAENYINLTNYINKNDVVVTIHNTTGKTLTIKSDDLIHNNFFCPEGTNNLEISPKSTARIYNIHIPNTTQYLKQAIIF